jgi:hypothetical protein
MINILNILLTNDQYVEHFRSRIGMQRGLQNHSLSVRFRRGLPEMEDEPARSWSRLESGWTRKGWVSTTPSSSNFFLIAYK